LSLVVRLAENAARPGVDVDPDDLATIEEFHPDVSAPDFRAEIVGAAPSLGPWVQQDYAEGSVVTHRGKVWVANYDLLADWEVEPEVMFGTGTVSSTVEYRYWETGQATSRFRNRGGAVAACSRDWVSERPTRRTSTSVMFAASGPARGGAGDGTEGKAPPAATYENLS
jgi:hypothetical protein